jgi:glyoxylase-like metal-dependent hydrolase (beta-lactamase superfamily II)
MERTVQIQAPLPHIGSVNLWLLRGDPLTLIDTGPRSDEALAALEAGLGREGLRVEDIELVIPTHHHLDHTGLIATIAARSGARVAALDRAAEYGAHYVERSAADRAFSCELMIHHGVPEPVIEANEGFWDYIRDASEAYRTDVVLSDGDVITAGGRDLRILARPGHSTTDALLVDEPSATAFVGDHLLAGISSNAEIVPVAEPTGSRPQARTQYLESLKRTAEMPLGLLLTGHGDAVADHRRLVRYRFAEHRRRCQRILTVLDDGPAHAYGIAKQLWSARTVAEQPVLVVWEVLGHLDLLLDEGKVSEHVLDDGSRYGKAWFWPREQATSSSDPSNGAAPPTSILYPGGPRPAELE